MLTAQRGDVRVAFITFEYPPHMIGGAGTYAEKVVAELARRGVHVDVFTPARDDYRPVPRVRIVGVPVSRRKPFAPLQFWLGLPDIFARAEREGRYDLVHFNGTCYWFLNRLTDSPKVVTIHHLARDSVAHDGAVGIMLSLIERRAMRMADRVVAVSEFTRGRILERCGIEPGRVGMVYNGGSYDKDASPDIESARALLSPLEGRRSVLFVGRLNDRRKGLDILVRAMARAAEHTDAVLVVAGKGDREEVKKLARSLGVEERIVFVGYVEDPVLLGLYSLTDVYACPSLLEGFGMTVLDAQSFAPKVVASKVGAIPEIAGGSTTLVDPMDVEALALAIVQALEGQQPPRPERDARTFTWEEAGSSLLREYRAARGGRRRTTETPLCHDCHRS